MAGASSSADTSTRPEGGSVPAQAPKATAANGMREPIVDAVRGAAFLRASAAATKSAFPAARWVKVAKTKGVAPEPNGSLRYIEMTEKYAAMAKA